MKKNLCEIPGTVAFVLNKRINEIDFDHGMQRAKTSICQVLKDESIIDKPLAATYEREIATAKNMSHVISIFTTYLTGVKVTSGKRIA